MTAQAHVAAVEAVDYKRPDTPPLPDDPPLHDSMTQELPSFEYRTSQPVRSSSREIPGWFLATRPETQSQPSASSADTVAEDLQRKLSNTSRNEPRETCTPSTASATLSDRSPGPRAADPALMSVDPTHQDVQLLGAFEACGGQSGTPASTTTLQETQDLTRASSVHSVYPINPPRQGADGVFARDQVMPWLFHVLEPEKNGMSIMMIEVCVANLTSHSY